MGQHVEIFAICSASLCCAYVVTVAVADCSATPILSRVSRSDSYAWLFLLKNIYTTLAMLFYCEIFYVSALATIRPMDKMALFFDRHVVSMTLGSISMNNRT